MSLAINRPEYPGFQRDYMREPLVLTALEQLEELIAQLRTEVRALQARLDDMDLRLGKGTV